MAVLASSSTLSTWSAFGTLGALGLADARQPDVQPGLARPMCGPSRLGKVRHELASVPSSIPGLLATSQEDANFSSPGPVWYGFCVIA